MKNPDEGPQGNIHTKLQQLHSFFSPCKDRSMFGARSRTLLWNVLRRESMTADKRNSSTKMHDQAQKRQRRHPKMIVFSALLQRARAWFKATEVEQQIKERDTSFQTCSRGNSLSLLLYWLSVQCTTDELNGNSPLAWSQNARRTIAVAVLVVTRQQVAGIESGRRGNTSLYVHRGVQRGSPVCAPAVTRPLGEWHGGWQGDKGSQQAGNEVANDSLNPLFWWPAHILKHYTQFSWRLPRGVRGEQTGTGSKIQLIHDRREGLGDTQWDGAGKPQEIGNNTPLSLDLCEGERGVCCYVASAFTLDQGQAVCYAEVLELELMHLDC